MKRFRFSVALLLCCIAALATAQTITREGVVFERDNTGALGTEPLLVVHFIDVGGGDAILIDTPSDRKILIDGGFTWGERSMAADEYSAYLGEFLAGDTVDLIIITHPDFDHFGGLSDVLDTAIVRRIWYTGYDDEDLSKSWGKFMNKVRSTEGLLLLSPLEDYMRPGSVVLFDDSWSPEGNDDVVLTILNTRREIGSHAYGSGRFMAESKRRNSSSLVVRMDFGNTSFLFTGDTNGRKKGDSDQEACDDQELFMVENDGNPASPLAGKLHCTVLKVPHHGSDGSSSLRFLESVHPAWAVISAGVPHGHPDSTVLDRLKRPEVGLADDHILRTDAGEDAETEAGEANLGDDCYQFVVDPEGIVRIEKLNIMLDAD